MIRSFAVGLMVIFVIVFSAATPVRTQAYADFVINEFAAEYEISDHSSPVMSVTETIDVNFVQKRHGIFRYVPTLYNVGLFKPRTDLHINVLAVEDESGQPRPYTTYSENDNIVIKIGDPNRYVDGEQAYVIKYTARNFIRFFDDHDEFYWDVNGTGWDTSANLVSAKVIFPEALVENGVGNVRCITGRLNEQNQDCKISRRGSVVSSETTKKFVSGENLSVVIAFDKGYFDEPSSWERWAPVIARHAGIALPLIVLPLLLFIWHRKGRDPAGKGSIITQFGPPDDLSPAHVGTVADFSADNQELSATIVDLAIRGYIVIHDETKSEHKKKRDYRFELKQSDTSALKPHEKSLLEGLFSDMKPGTSVQLKSLKNSFYTTAGKIKSELYRELTRKRYFAHNPKVAKGIMLGFGGAAVFVSFMTIAVTEAQILGWSIGGIITGLLVVIFGLVMPKRTYKGVLANEHILGLKNYMEVAEKDRIKMMQSPNSRYIGDTTAPKFTVELYEKLLPYAMVLGVEKQWSEKFASIYNQPPEWYDGQWTTFNAGVFAGRLSSGMSNVGTVMTTSPSSSSGSGFSGGSGGGFGGGGGGSW